MNSSTEEKGEEGGKDCDCESASSFRLVGALLGRIWEGVGCAEEDADVVGIEMLNEFSFAKFAEGDGSEADAETESWRVDSCWEKILS
jgi:hypothetical protein